MGVGIAIDVAIATVSRFRDGSMTLLTWTVPVVGTHIVLPAIGYYGWWYLGASFHQLGLILGLSAFLMISIFLYETFCDWINAAPLVSLKPLTRVFLRGADSSTATRVVAILAVSMDALWSGPAKAAQAESAAWTPVEVLISFLIAGLVVAVVAEASLLISKLLRRVDFRNIRRLAMLLVGGKFLEASVLWAFGLLSLWNAFAPWLGLGELGFCILASVGFMLIVWQIFWNRLNRKQLAELSARGSG